MKELDKAFQKNQHKRDTCGMKTCHAPKYDTLPTDYGLQISVCAYHFIEMTFQDEDKDWKSQEILQVQFSTLKKKWKEYNQKIKGKEVEFRE